MIEVLEKIMIMMLALVIISSTVIAVEQLGELAKAKEEITIEQTSNQYIAYQEDGKDKKIIIILDKSLDK